MVAAANPWGMVPFPLTGRGKGLASTPKWEADAKGQVAGKFAGVVPRVQGGSDRLRDRRWLGGLRPSGQQERMSQIPDHAPRSVSVENQFPEDLFDAMREFVRVHPQWDQYRLMQAALAGFLFQQGCQDRAVARHYLDGLFHREGSPQGRPG